MRILIADSFPKERVNDLIRLGLDVESRPDISVKDLPEAAKAASILVVRGKKVTAEVFEHAASLSLVVRAGAGVNTIDVAAASRRGVYVANCPGQNAIAVAELALGLLIALDRRIPDNVAALKAGHWEKKRFSEAWGLYGRTLGVAGLGAIGRAVVARAIALGMRVVAWSRSLDDAAAKALGVERAPTLVSLARASDYLSLHLPLSKETRGIVSDEVLAALKDGAGLVNTARAEIVDQAALFSQVSSAGRIRLATDVYPDEPDKGQADYHPALTELSGVYGTHHIGASTAQAQDAIAKEAVRIVASFLSAGEVPNCVNIARKTPAKARVVVRHLDQVGVLAGVLGLMREAGLNVERVRNTVFEEAQAASCSMDVAERPPEALLTRIRADPAVLFVDCVEV